jgi:amino acid adenylation domain-containing protein
MIQPGRSLISGFLRSLERYPDRVALEIGDLRLGYAQLWEQASRIAAALDSHCDPAAPLVALLANRSVTAYAGILGILATGRGYVPLNPKFPTERTLTMLTASGCTTVIAGAECAKPLASLLPRLGRPLTWLLAGKDEAFEPAVFPAWHTVIPEREMTGRVEANEPCPSPQATAYLLFTSGSTGIPKGVAVSQLNICSYLEYVGKRYGLTPEDRCSQNFDLTFDLSVHDLFTCWGAGAALCSFSEQVLVPATVIEDSSLTVWFSVPSLAMFANKIGLLTAAAFPKLRLSLFCGEALSARLAERWQHAAQASVIENIYGPTETTVAITHYRWEAAHSSAECVNGIVPIGWVFEGQECCIVDDSLSPCLTGQQGELCLTGSQVTSGYLNDPGKTLAQFVHIEGFGDKLWYRTGDLVYQDERKCLYFLGRKDQQVKVNGYRVELQEIDLVLREIAGTELAVAVPWPVAEGTAAGIVAVLCGADSSIDGTVIESCAKRLPRYMVPAQVYHFDNLPLNVNGKVDRKQITERLLNLNSRPAS